MLLKWIVSIILLSCLMSLHAEEIEINEDSDIEDEISIASAGDELIFHPGVYILSLTLGDKALTLRSLDTTNTIIEAEKNLPAIDITGNQKIQIRNFTFRESDLAIEVSSDDITVDVTLQNNVFVNGDESTAILVGERGLVTIENNVFYDLDIGISGSNSSSIRVENNIFEKVTTEFDNVVTSEVNDNCFDFEISEVPSSNIVETVDYADVENNDFHMADLENCVIEETQTTDEIIFGAFGGDNADEAPNSVSTVEAEVSNSDATVSWESNNDYRVDGYRVYFSNLPLEEKNTFSERDALAPIDAGTSLSATITDLESTSVVLSAPTLTRISPANKKLTVQWNAIDGATGYEVTYSGDGVTESIDVTDGESVDIAGLKNDLEYTVSVKATMQTKYYIQVAAYINEPEGEASEDEESILRESYFNNDDIFVLLDDKKLSDSSNSLTGIPEAILAYPNLPNEGCFIATAAYGFYSAEEVQVLRDFRDTYLLVNEPGKMFVNWYYTYGPAWAEHINQYEYLKPVVRAFLYPVIVSIKLFEYSKVAFLLIGVSLLLLVSFFLAYFKKQQIRTVN